ncbi:coiled-coil domain-containing protein [Raoultibacter timonensis]|uniref:coiled-coil domain-containing protein n=1 Tax=Raoultibacter timonensis TaxID=1907662 RepID=UPI0026DD60AE|nr:C40 family peptidase [Raoultibacter timonensis]
MEQNRTKVTRRAFLGGAAAFGAVSLTMPSLAFADPTSASKQAEADEVRSRVAAMQSELSQKSEEYYAALDAHDAAVAACDEAQARIDEASGQISELQEKLGTRARSMYRSGGTSFLDLLLGATTFEEFVTNWDILNQMNENDATMVQQTKDLRAEVEAQREELSKQEQIASDKAEEARVNKENAEVTVAALQAELDSLDAEARELLLAEQEEAAAAARAAEAEENANRPNSGSGGGGSSNSGGNDGGNDGGGGGNDGGGGGNDGGGGGSSSGGGNYVPPNGSVVDYAVYCLGTPYVYGGNTPGVGLDCSGLTYWCYRQVGKTIPRTTYGMPNSAAWSGPVSSAEPGDVLWNSGHVAICTASGGGTYIHAPQPGDVVKYSSWPQFSLALRF